MRSARVAWAFLTRLPGGHHPAPGESLAGALPWFPAVGAVIGALTGLVFLGLSEITSATIAAVAAVAAGAVVTGGFHEDGLADTADSFGGYDRERRLEIMRDSRLGTFGTLALTLGVLTKVVALSGFDGPDGLLALVAAHAVARAGALVTMRIGPEARPDGLAAAAADVPASALIVALLLVVGSAAIGPGFLVAGAAVLALAVGGALLGRRHLGGTTGDLLGAVEQVGEIAILTILVELGGIEGWLW